MLINRQKALVKESRSKCPMLDKHHLLPKVELVDFYLCIKGGYHGSN